MKPLRKKTLALISYLTVIGWLVAYFYYNKRKKSSLINYHLKQSFGLLIITIISNIIIILLLIINMIVVILCIAGIISAAYGVRLALPVIGTFFEDKFNFIK
jgi:uncharacterized membrane protein